MCQRAGRYLPGPQVLVVGGGHVQGTALPTSGTPHLKALRLLGAEPWVNALETATPVHPVVGRGVVDRAVDVLEMAVSHDGALVVVLDSTGALHTFRAPSLAARQYVG